MSDAYSNCVGGSLRLKGGGISKKKKRREKEQNSDTTLTVSQSSAAASSSAAGIPEDEGSRPPPRLHTDAEARRLETIRQRKMQLAEEGKLKSHRDKVRDFNNYLSNLTEHYDLPKVSKGN
mmetsp:Transcript_18669/g.36226  ORF Transcript_18669/g.36226 Transcript_18669/m.36226 type:complete len:121 (+) Transcript_18669:166-528(+)